MSSLLLFLVSIAFFIILIFIISFYKKLNNQSIKKNIFEYLISTTKGREYNPDINTNNWDLHKNRLMKFGRSQYKGLTFFVSSEDRIYYLSEKGTRVYC